MLKFHASAPAPAYTVRMLLSNITSAQCTDIPKLKPFSHFTLACTRDDQAAQVTASFDRLVDRLKNPIVFKANQVINLGSAEQPLWAVKLTLGNEQEQLREFLSELFDSIMTHERNGTLYLWQPTSGAELKCPHVTIGAKEEDRIIATKLVAENCELMFDQVDYKKVGPTDPHVSRSLRPLNETNTMQLTS